MVDPDPVRRARHSEEAAVDSFGASDETGTASESEPTACDQGVTRAACSAKLALGCPGDQLIHGGLAERRECPIQRCCLAGIPVNPFGELGGGCDSFLGDEDSLSLKQRRSPRDQAEAFRYRIDYRVSEAELPRSFQGSEGPSGSA